jgi:hypothetical protein
MGENKLGLIMKNMAAKSEQFKAVKSTIPLAKPLEQHYYMVVHH